MRRHVAGLRHERRLDTFAHEAVEFGFGPLVFDGAGKLRADLLHDRDLRAAFADFFRIDAGRNRARRAEDGDRVGVVLLRILRRGHRPRRLRCGLDRRRDDAEHVVCAGPAALRQPLLLQPAQRYGRRRVAAEQRQLGAAREQVFDAARV